MQIIFGELSKVLTNDKLGCIHVPFYYYCKFHWSKQCNCVSEELRKLSVNTSQIKTQYYLLLLVFMKTTIKYEGKNML